MTFLPMAIARMAAISAAVALIVMQPRPDEAIASLIGSDAQSAHGVAAAEPVSSAATTDLAATPVAEPAIEPGMAQAETATEPVTAQHGMDAETICLAKIVHHESANQPREGQLAVAQVVMNRLASPRFPKTICAIALQPGQFFNVHAYNPRQDHRWALAVEIALDARNGVSPPVVGEALFFHAAHAQPSFHRSRPRVTQIGHHVFYR